MLQKYRSLFIVLAILTWIFAGAEILQRAAIDLHGIVVSSETSCVQPQNNRCATTYVVETQLGVQKTYTAGPTDKALRRGLPVGTVLVKDKWRLSYSINGERVDDFPSGFYWGQMVFGLFCALLWYVPSMRGR